MTLKKIIYYFSWFGGLSGQFLNLGLDDLWSSHLHVWWLAAWSAWAALGYNGSALFLVVFHLLHMVVSEPKDQQERKPQSTALFESLLMSHVLKFYQPKWVLCSIWIGGKEKQTLPVEGRISNVTLLGCNWGKWLIFRGTEPDIWLEKFWMRTITGPFPSPLVIEQQLQRALLTYPRFFARLRASCQEFFCIKTRQSFPTWLQRLIPKAKSKGHGVEGHSLGITVPHTVGWNSPSFYATCIHRKKWPRPNNATYLHTAQGGRVCSSYHSKW